MQRVPWASNGPHHLGNLCAQALDVGADGVLIPYINTAEEAAAAISCALYPTAGTRSVYFPQRSMNSERAIVHAANMDCSLTRWP